MRLAGVKSDVCTRARCSPGQDNPKQKKEAISVPTNYSLLYVSSLLSKVGRFELCTQTQNWKYRLPAVKETFF